MAGVHGSPMIRTAYPVVLEAGMHVHVTCRLQRSLQGRLEVLVVNQEFEVTASTVHNDHQVVTVRAVAKEPVWHAIKKPPRVQPNWAPAKAPRTPLE